MVKNLPANAGDAGEAIPALGRSFGGGNGDPFLPGKPHGQRSPVGYSSWDHKQSDTIECTHAQRHKKGN